jgi:hypothetical protein
MEAIYKLVRPDVRRSPHEMSFRFMRGNGIYYRKYNPDILGITTFIPEFDLALSKFDTALELVRKSPETDRIVALDYEFNNTFVAMTGFAKAALKHYDPVVKIAAENINIVFKHYGNIGKQPYRQERASSQNLLQELEARDRDVTKLRLRPWIEEHRRVTVRLVETLDTRTSETAQKQTFALPTHAENWKPFIKKIKNVSTFL